MALVYVQLPLRLKIIHPHPRVLAAARHELTCFRVQSHRRDFVGGLDRLEQLSWHSAGEEVRGFPCRDCQGRGGKVVELAAANGAIEVVDGGNGAGADVPPADFFIVGCGDENVGVRAPDDGLDDIVVNARTDFVARSDERGAVHPVGTSGGGRGTAVAARAGAREVEDSQLLFMATGCKELWIGL